MATSEQISSEQKSEADICYVSKSPATYTKELKHIKSSIRHRNVCATLNNYTDLEYNFAKHFIHNNCSYGIVAKEVGDVEQTPHLQCYFEFSSQKTQLSILKNLGEDVNIGKPIRWYFEERRGTSKQASDYCRYADYDRKTHSGTKLNEFIEAGELSKQGERVDWARAVNDVVQRRDVVDIVKEQPHLLPNLRSLERLSQLTLKPLRRDVKVIVRYGSSRTGKSYWAWNNYPDLYSKPKGAWWDGYNGQKTILLDDFYGDIRHSELLNILDPYPLNLPVKGGFIYAQYDTVIITSNNPPDRWYKFGLTPQLCNRITECYYLKSRDDVERVILEPTSHHIVDETV